MIYFTSDHHFNNSLMYEYRKKTSSSQNLFNNIGEMNKLMIKNVNDTLKEGDVLYILGDFGDYEYISFFNPKIKYTIMIGNHDEIPDDYGEIPINTLKKVVNYNNLDVTIITCSDKDVFIEKKYNSRKEEYESIEVYPLMDKFLLLSHKPINRGKLLDFSINIHGHLHPGKFHGYALRSDVNSRAYADRERYWNATVDYNEFKPVSLKTIYERLELLPIE